MIYGGLSAQDEVTKFIEAVTNDVRLVMKVGAMALSLYVRALHDASKEKC
jgi:hypothetical protein